MTGQIREILTGTSAGAELASLSSGEFEAGRGLVGDRYYHGKGTFSTRFDGTPAVEATLIAQMGHMVHKAGIRAQIATGGVIRVGDPVNLVG